ncbi:MAG TPA: tetratricopeptide repeat protein [Gaiellaceae bacterium]
MVPQPTGTVTLVFTDVEGSTRLLERLGADRYAAVLEEHRRLLRVAFARRNGYEVGTEGDSFFVAFARAEDAVAAVDEGQRALVGVAWPEGAAVQVRMGVHTGQPLAVDGNYVGMDVHRAARVMAAAHGGQVLVSETTALLLDGVALRDLGLHRLKDLLEPIRLYQLEMEGLPGEFPPLRSLHRSNLPTATWPLLGREPELAKIRALVSEGARLVTLTGPGGSGKTRLALQAAAELSDEFPDGVFFVGLAPLRDVVAVRGTVAEAVGLQADDDVIGWLSSRRVLLVLDNLEHLGGVEVVIAELLVGATVVVGTSRAPLRLSAERELPVEPLPREAAVELFVSRAAAAGRQIAANGVVGEICRRLDDLPLALELAAARVRLLSPAALLERLDDSLSLLTGGARDLSERQRTLRATIQWSHDLLSPEEQAVFRRLSVFRGPFTLESAEVVVDADFDQIATLVEQSLLKPLGDDRFFLLETLREYGRERLSEAAESTPTELKHAHYYLAKLRQHRKHLFGPQRGPLLSWFEAEEDNLRAALDRLENASPADAAEAANLLAWYWLPRNQPNEARQRIRKLLDTASLTAELRTRLLSTLAECEFRADDHDAALAIAREALALAEGVGDRETVAMTLSTLSYLAVDRGDLQQASDLLTRALAQRIHDPWTDALLHAGRASVATHAGRNDEARQDFRTAQAGFRVSGDEANEASCAIQLAELELYAGRFEEAATAVTPALDWARATGDRYRQGGAACVLGLAELGRNHPAEAVAAFNEGLELILPSERTRSRIFSNLLSGIAWAAGKESLHGAARLFGAASRLKDEIGAVATQPERELETRFTQPLIDLLGEAAWTEEQTAGALLTLEQTVAVGRSLAATTTETNTTPGMTSGSAAPLRTRGDRDAEGGHQTAILAPSSAQTRQFSSSPSAPAAQSRHQPASGVEPAA